MPRYLLVNSEEALNSFALLFPGNLPDDIVFVASTSVGMVACERARIAYSTLDQYSPRAEIISLGWGNYSSLATFCERWDAAAQEFMPCLKIRGIKPFRFSYYDLKILVDSISTKLLMLKNFIHHAEGQEIFYLPEPDHGIVTGELLRPRSNINMFSVLLETVLKDEVNLLALPSHRGPQRTGLQLQLRAGLSAVCARLSKVRNTFRSLGSYTHSAKRGWYLCLSYGHDIQYVVPHLTKRQLRLIPIPEATADTTPDITGECDLLWQKLLMDKDFSKFFCYGETSYFTLISESLAAYVKSVLPRAVSNYDHSHQVLSRFDIRFLLTGSINLGLVTRCRMLAAQACGAPLITYTEGAGYGSVITPIYDFTEAVDGDVMLCYGSGNSEYYEDMGTAKRLIIPVGSAHQDAVQRGVRDHIPPTSIQTVMYVGTTVQDNVVHCPNNGLVSTFYLATQIKIFHLLASLPSDRHVIVKPNPHDGCTPSVLQLAEFKRIQLETRRFEEVMRGVNLFILDFPSTVLLSCIATTAYVFVLAEAGTTGFTTKQKERLEKRAYLFEDFDSLASAVREIATSTVGFPLRLDDSYMMAYSLYKPDGNSAERAAEVLAGLSKGELRKLA